MTREASIAQRVVLSRLYYQAHVLNDPKEQFSLAEILAQGFNDSSALPNLSDYPSFIPKPPEELCDLPNVELALEYYEKSAGQGHLEGAKRAYHLLMERHEYDKAKQVLSLVNHPTALKMLGDHARTIDHQEKQSFSFWLKAALLSESDAQLALARCYYQGEGTDVNTQRGDFWLEKAFNHGKRNASTCSILARKYRDAMETGGDLDVLDETAHPVDEDATATTTPTAADHTIPDREQPAESNPDNERTTLSAREVAAKALELTQSAAAQGDSGSLLALAMAYQGVLHHAWSLPIDMDKAFDYFMQTAEMGNLHAVVFGLGILYRLWQCDHQQEQQNHSQHEQSKLVKASQANKEPEVDQSNDDPSEKTTDDKADDDHDQDQDKPEIRESHLVLIRDFLCRFARIREEEFQTLDDLYALFERNSGQGR